jgi:hypothetical protein
MTVARTLVPRVLPTVIVVLYPRYRGSSVTAQKLGNDRFPSATSDWGTIHPIPDMALSLQDEEAGLL